MVFADTVIRGAVRSGAAAVLLAMPLTLALYFRADWMIWFGIPTPDHSLIPELTSLVCFGTALAFGWLVHRQLDLLHAWKKQWATHLAVGARRHRRLHLDRRTDAIVRPRGARLRKARIRLLLQPCDLVLELCD